MNVHRPLPLAALCLSLLPAQAAQDPPADDALSFLPELLEELRARVAAPGMSVAVAYGDGLVVTAVAGVRVQGGEQPVEPEDRFHIGSVTKPITATLIAHLIEEGHLERETYLGDALPDMEMLQVYGLATVDQLLTHRAGIPPYTTFDDAEDARLSALTGTPSEQRVAFLAEVLQADPVAEPGSAFHYSNAGYVLLARIAEVATDRSWEELVREVVLTPLDMSRTGTGWPATPERPDQPLGHMGTGGSLEVQPIGGWEVGAFLAPAGDVHASASDLARFGLEHAHGLAGRDGLLLADTVAWLHEPPPGAAPRGAYARGWFVSPLGSWHPGSAGSFYALLHLLPEREAAVAILVNCGDPSSHSAGLELVERVQAALE